MVGMLELIPGTTSSHDRHMQRLSVKVEYSTYECLASASGSYLYHRGQPLQKQTPRKEAACNDCLGVRGLYPSHLIDHVTKQGGTSQY